MLDIAGNVWEWTSSLYKPYPYDANDGREIAEGDGRRVLQGGSWSVNPGNAAASFRNRGFPVGASANV